MSQLGQAINTAQTLNYQLYVRYINWLDLTSPPISVFPVTPLSTFAHGVWAHSLLKTHPPLQSRTCNKPSLLPKELKTLDVPIHLRTHQKGTLQPKLGILLYLYDQYLSTTSNPNLSPTQSPNVKILFKCARQSSHQLGLVHCGIGASPIHYRIKKSSKPLLKIDKFTLTKI